MSRDVYVRLTPHGPRSFGVAEPYRTLVFVDLHDDAVGRLRQTPQGVIDRPAAVLIRCEARPRQLPAKDTRPGLLSHLTPWKHHKGQRCPEHDRRLRELRDDVQAKLRLNCPVGLLCQPVGAPPELEFLGEPPEDAADLLARARAVELRALLDWGNAIWEPEDFHYRLPSGEHAAVFVRIADAIREPRDAHVLATWLRPHVTDGLAVICDSGTISAVIESLKASAFAAGIELGTAAVLDEYPASPLDVSQAVREIARKPEKSDVLGVLSVNSSGQVAGWLWWALRSLAGAIRSWNLEIMVDRRPRAGDNERCWLPLPGEQPLLGQPGASEAKACQLCLDPDRERVIPINPMSFDGMMPGQIRELMPSIADARRNAAFWEQCSRVGAIGLLEEADDDVQVFRPAPEKMPIRFRHNRLVAAPDYRATVKREVMELVKRHVEAGRKERDEGNEPWQRRHLSGEADLVLVPEHETQHPGYEELWAEVSPEIAAPGVSYSPFPVEGEWSEDLLAKIDAAEDILVFALGLVTGGSLARSLMKVQVRRKDRQFAVRALVMHARPERQREWEALENAFDKRLFPVWHSLITNRELLTEELAVLEDTNTAELSEDANDFLNARTAFCGGDLEEPSMFWGARAEDVLTPHSLFGEELNGIATLVAVGSAMERARQAAGAKSAPEMLVFELGALTASYFDAMIIAAVFRWLRPREAWWGSRPEEAEGIVTRLMEHRPEQEHLRIVLPELLLAAAQGKVPERAAEVLIGKAEALLAASDFTAPERAALEVGIHAVERRKEHPLSPLGTA